MSANSPSTTATIITTTIRPMAVIGNYCAFTVTTTNINACSTLAPHPCRPLTHAEHATHQPFSALDKLLKKE